nr:MAG TPA: hypothetical protein [Caudoviricetes sp.]
MAKLNFQMKSLKAMQKNLIVAIGFQKLKKSLKTDNR